MTLPQWNSEWEKPDPLRGAQGWSGHHFVTVGAAVVLVLFAIGLVLPAVWKARLQERDLDQAWKKLMESMADASVSAPGPSPREEPSGEAPAVKDGGRQTFTDPRNRFSVTFPSTPELKPPSGVVANGLSELAVWEARDGDTKYTLAAIYAPVELLKATFDLDQLARSGDNPYWRVVARQEVTLDGEPGKRVEYAVNDGLRASMSVFARCQGTVVMLSVNGPSGRTGASQEAQAFFESFRFTRASTPVEKYAPRPNPAQQLMGPRWT
jgi:hypothetical protein